MTHEEIARKNIQNAINHIVGSYYTSFLDGYEDDLPKCYEELEAEVYESSLKDTYAYGGEVVFYNRPVKEMRFAGSDFCKSTVHSLLSEDEAVKEMIEDLGWAVTVPDAQENVIWSGYVLKKTIQKGIQKESHSSIFEEDMSGMTLKIHSYSKMSHMNLRNLQRL